MNRCSTAPVVDLTRNRPNRGLDPRLRPIAMVWMGSFWNQPPPSAGRTSGSGQGLRLRPKSRKQRRNSTQGKYYSHASKAVRLLCSVQAILGTTRPHTASESITAEASYKPWFPESRPMCWTRMYDSHVSVAIRAPSLTQTSWTTSLGAARSARRARRELWLGAVPGRRGQPKAHQ